MSLRARLDLKPSPGFVSSQVTDARRYFLNMNPPPGGEITVVCGGCERTRADYVVDRGDFPYFALEFVAEGEGIFRLRDAEFPLRPGAVFSYGPKMAHQIRNTSRAPMLKYYVDFAGTGARKLLAESPLGTSPVAQISSPQEVADLFELLQREGASQSPFTPKLCAQLLTVLLLKISERAVPAGRAEPRAMETFQRAKRTMEKCFLELRCAEEAAAACHLNPSYLCRLFQRFGHTTPYQFILKLKMSRAAELLLDERMLAKEAASALNFADAFHFSRAFKRFYGISPTQFARQSHR